MNELLVLKGKFEQKPNTVRNFSLSLREKATVSAAHLQKLILNLQQLKKYWENEQIISGALISIVYKTVIAKSRRISKTFSTSKATSNASIVGAKFITEDGRLKHLITHYIDISTLNRTIEEYKAALNILETNYNGIITAEDIKRLNKNKNFKNPLISRTCFEKIIIDVSSIERFEFPQNEITSTNNSIISLYDIKENTLELLKKMGILVAGSRLLDSHTLYLTPDEISILQQKAPFLISMGVSDLKELTKDYFEDCPSKQIEIPSPTNEPTIGVIDTLFSETVYFSEWVEYKCMLDPNIDIELEDFEHGTKVTSIIVDGPTFNKHLDDGCGRFRVRHFGVAKAHQFSSLSVLRSIQEIIAANKDIKVWNLSLGSAFDINQNFISPEAAILDKIQTENDVIFVIAGTNKIGNNNKKQFIGAPADSINSLVVNAVNSKGEPASYSRTGPVLSFFVKPDIAYYGGDDDKLMCVCTPTGAGLVKGTSFAAPWIARKLSYLIDILGFNREVAKALLIHSATSWQKETISPNIIGYGVVPINIKEIIQSPKDEIRFVITEHSDAYDTYSYNLPVPIVNNKQPFIAKATLCYFPVCSRNQGVDYTNTEFDISFGRIRNSEPDKGRDFKIEPINKNYQSQPGSSIYEEDARSLYRKWDNIKHVREIQRKNRSKDLFSPSGFWGISVKTKERLEEKHGKGVKFGIVITLKEITGRNRINEFIQQCKFNSWIVDRVNVDNRLNIYNIAEEEVTFNLE